MKSISVTSFEIDDPASALDQLVAGVQNGLTLQANSFGILLADADFDGAALSAGLKQRLGLDVAGFTTLATFDREGHHENAAVLTVLTADDVRFCAAASEPFSEDYREQMIATYRATIPADAAADEHPGLILLFAPNGEPFSGDKYPDLLGAATAGAPIIGGVCSDDYDYARARVFLSGREYADSMVLVSLWGNVRPLFSIRHVTSDLADRTQRVKRARDNVVYEMDRGNLVEFLEGFGLDTSVEDPLLAFTSYPMMLTSDNENEVPLMRHILTLDCDLGSGTFVGDVPEGTLANICLVSREDLKVSARESMQGILEQIEAQTDGGGAAAAPSATTTDAAPAAPSATAAPAATAAAAAPAAPSAAADYRYSTVFCVSCCGRAIILGTEADAEGDEIKALLPDDLVLTGAYALGEICPTHYAHGVATNRFHNCSITLCAF
ncbi:MAG: FIST C-terminal domain-containing protein [Coriobacteriales bacterium]|jgi:hypothetical protein|nr:FIST C-terminal domain-containing protein [Coriobacteriales bacterium]